MLNHFLDPVCINTHKIINTIFHRTSSSLLHLLLYIVFNLHHKLCVGNRRGGLHISIDTGITAALWMIHFGFSFMDIQMVSSSIGKHGFNKMIRDLIEINNFIYLNDVKEKRVMLRNIVIRDSIKENRDILSVFV